MHLTPIRPVFDSPGPYVTVHADVSRSTEDARQQLDARWRNIQQVLGDEGVDPSLLETIGARLHDNHHVPGEARLTIVGADDRVLFEDLQPGHSTAPETWEVAALPDLSGWLQGQEGSLRFGLAVLDREGADIDFYAAANRGSVDHQEVTGETFGIT